MKNLKSLFAMLSLAIFVALSFSSCKDDKNEPSEDSYSLTGKWRVTSSEWKEKVNGKIVDSGKETYSGDEIGMIFKPNGTGMFLEDGEYEDDFEWFISGKNLFIEDSMYTIENYSSTSMTLIYSENGYEDGEKYSYEFKMNLIKVQ